MNRQNCAQLTHHAVEMVSCCYTCLNTFVGYDLECNYCQQKKSKRLKLTQGSVSSQGCSEKKKINKVGFIETAAEVVLNEELNIPFCGSELNLRKKTPVWEKNVMLVAPVVIDICDDINANLCRSINQDEEEANKATVSSIVPPVQEYIMPKHSIDVTLIELSNESGLSLIDLKEIDDFGINECLFCQENLDLYDSAAREFHMNKCVDMLENKNKSGSISSVRVDLDFDLRAESLSCIICDVDISKRNLLSRCAHIKKCAKSHNLGVKDVLKMMSSRDEFAVDEEDLGDIFNTFGQMEEDEKMAKLLHEEINGTISSPDATGNENDESTDSTAKIVPLSLDVNSFLMSNCRSVRKVVSEVPLQKSSLIRKEDTPANINSFLMSAARESAKNKSIQDSNSSKNRTEAKGRSWGGGKKWAWVSTADTTDDGYAPNYKKVLCGSMTLPIVVDGFNYASRALTDTYFLTHFHSDHYTGLTNNFDCGRIYCSPTTAALVALRLRLKGVVIPMTLEKKHKIVVGGSEVEVTLVDANHCPGAVCIIFEFSNGKKILHTGDFRWTERNLSHSPALRLLASNINNSRNLTVYLDTTYCDAQYDFPDQMDAISAVITVVDTERGLELIRPTQRTLYVFGAYGIGKERLFMAVALHLGLKVYVDKNRWRGMMCYDWGLEEKGRLTTDCRATPIWVASMNQINFKAISAMKKKGNYSKVVAFQPTGWSHGGKSAAADPSADSAVNKGDYRSIVSNRQNKEGDVIYSVPYSEHSSFTELILFLNTFKPHRVVPTVNTSMEKVKAQLALLKGHSILDLTSNM